MVLIQMNVLINKPDIFQNPTLTYRIIEQITILSKEEIRIRFVGGYEITQSLLQ